MGSFPNNGRSLIYFKQAQVWATGDIEQNATRSINGYVE
jgi:hypothetical protein